MNKQIGLALSLLGLTATAFAGYPGRDQMLPAAPPSVNVTIPQQPSSWQIGLELLYLQPANGDFHYSTTDLATSNPALDLVQSNPHTAEGEQEFGGHIDASYLFGGNGRDIQIGWTHLNGTEKDTSNRALNDETLSGFVSPDAGTFPDGWDTSRGQTETEYDAVDLTFGQKMDFGTKVTLHAFAGLRWADITNHDIATYNAADIITTGTVEAGEHRVKSDFQGIGPRAGMNGMVRMGSGFSFVGSIAGSLLVGERDQSIKSRLTSTDPNVAPVVTNTNQTISDDTRVVPELDARLGINFSYYFYSDTSLGIELGYQATNYFDVKNGSGQSYTDTMKHENDFALHGPYLRLQIDLA